MYRLTKDKDDQTSSKYLTVDPADRAFYKWSWTDSMRNYVGSVNKDQPIYENTYINKEELRSPSMIKRRDIAANLVRNDQTRGTIVSELARNRTTDSFLRQNPGMTTTKARSYVTSASAPDSEYSDLVKDMNPRSKKMMDSLRQTYNYYNEQIGNHLKDHGNDNDGAVAARFVLKGMGQSDIIKMEYGKKVIEAGYNMSIDDYGANFYKEQAQVNAPIIVYMANDLLKKVGSKPVSDLDVKRAYRKAMDVTSSDRKQLYKYHIPNVIKESDGLKWYYGDSSSYYV